MQSIHLGDVVEENDGPLAPPLDFGEFGIANGFELGFVNSNVLNDVLIAHDDRAPAVGNRTHC
jgi:hypothetical protein